MVTRPLTVGEIGLAKTVFGDSIDYTKVTVSDQPFIRFQAEGVAMAPNGKLYMHGCYKDDYARQNIYGQSLFIHEMAHVWQCQNRILNPIASAAKLSLKFRFDYAAAYFYDLKAGKDLLSYNMEQQASIVEDYFVLSRGGDDHRGHCRNQESGQARAELYKNVLKKFLENPAYAAKRQRPKKPRPPTA